MFLLKRTETRHNPKRKPCGELDIRELYNVKAGLIEPAYQNHVAKLASDYSTPEKQGG